MIVVSFGVLLVGILAQPFKPSAECQAKADGFCLSDCAPALRKACEKYGDAKYARKSGPTPSMWRCYPKGELVKNETYSGTGGCYCSRDSKIRAILKDCGDPDPSPGPSPSPPKPPPHHIHPFPVPPVPSLGRGTSSTSVFYRGQTAADGTVYPCVRIPGIVNAEGVLLAFSECRRSTGDGCLPANFTSGGERDVCMRRSVDTGVTWGPLIVIAKDAGQDTAVYDAVAKLVVVSLLGVDGNGQVVSKDQGLSWDNPTSLGLKHTSETGPGVGIQLSATNPHAPGRLLFIGHAGAYVQDYVFYSDDHGKSYSFSKTVTGESLLKMDEAQLVELENGYVLANMRNEVAAAVAGSRVGEADEAGVDIDAANHYRGVALSTDGGTTFGAVTYDRGLPEPVCMGSVIRAPAATTCGAPGSGDGAVYFANPGSHHGRQGGLVRRSTNCTGLPSDGDCDWGGGSFAVFQAPVTPNAYGYSCLVPLNCTHIGLLYETNSSLCSGASCQQVFAAIPISSFV